MKVFFAVVDRFVRWVFLGAVSALVLLFVLETLRIFCRYFLGMPLNWVPGLVTLLTNWTVGLGVGYYLYVNQVIAIDYFYNKWFSPPAQKVLDFGISSIIVCFTTLMAYNSYGIMLMGFHQASMSTLKIYYFWYTLPIFLGMILGMLGGFKRLIIIDIEHKG